MIKNILAFLLFFTSLHGFCQDTIPASKALENLDKVVIVKGKVMGFKSLGEGSIHIINIDKPYPNNIFDVVITNENLEKFKINLPQLKGKTIIIRGKITTYKDKKVPQIFNPESFVIKKE